MTITLRTPVTILFILVAPIMCMAQTSAPSRVPGFDFISLVVPALLAVAGYFGKSLYDIYANNKKRRRELIENKLRFFYWPIYIRLKKNENTYRFLLKGKKDSNPLSNEYIIAHYVEKNVLLKNHEEILQIITDYRYLADSDENFEIYLNSYIRHVTIYKAFLDASINEYPGVATDAPYPTQIDDYFYQKTIHLQNVLESMTF